MVALQERVRDGNANTLEDVRLAGVMVIHVIVTVGGVALGRNLNGLSACVNALDISLRRSERVAEGEHMERFGTFLFHLGGRHSPGLALRVRRPNAHENLNIMICATPDSVLDGPDIHIVGHVFCPTSNASQRRRYGICIWVVPPSLPNS